MKINARLFLLFATLLISVCAVAQTGSIPYQAVARDSFNTPLPDRAISLRFSVREGSSGGTVLYKETDTVTTNKLGLFTSYIGEGHPVTGTFASINWGSGAKYLQVEADAAGGTSYVDLGASQLKSVPYSLRAVKSDDVSAIPSKRIPYATSTGLSSDACFTRDGADGNTRIGVKKGENYYALLLGDSNIINAGTGSINLPSAALYYADTGHTYSMSIGVGKIPAYGINQLGFLSLSMANGHAAGISFMEAFGTPQVILDASKYGGYSGIGSSVTVRAEELGLEWRHGNKNAHGVVADSLSLKLFSSLDTSQRNWTWPNTEGAAGQPLVTNGSGILSFAPLGGNATVMGQPVVDAANVLTSDSIPIFNNKNNIYVSTVNVTTLLVQLPTSPSNGDVFILTIGKPVSNIIYSGGNVGDSALTTASQGTQKIYTYHSATNKWY